MFRKSQCGGSTTAILYNVKQYYLSLGRSNGLHLPFVDKCIQLKFALHNLVCALFFFFRFPFVRNQTITILQLACAPQAPCKLCMFVCSLYVLVASNIQWWQTNCQVPCDRFSIYCKCIRNFARFVFPSFFVSINHSNNNNYVS